MSEIISLNQSEPEQTGPNQFDLSDQLHPPFPKKLAQVELDPHILRIGTGRVRADLTEHGLDTNTLKGRVTLLLSHVMDEYMEATEIERLPTAGWLLTRYGNSADYLLKSKSTPTSTMTQNLVEHDRVNRGIAIYETLMSMTNDRHKIPRGETMIVLTERIRNEFPLTVEAQLTDLIIRQYYLDVLEKEFETKQISPLFCQRHV